MTVHSEPTFADSSPDNPADRPPAWLDDLGDGCLLLDRNLTVLYVNTAFAHTLVRSGPVLVGRPLAALLEEGSEATAYRLAVAALQTGSAQQTDVQAGERTVHLRAHPSREGVVVVRIDVTSRQDAERERNRQLEMNLLAQKRESLARFATGVAHDINNLLSAIVGSASLLLRELPPGAAYDSATIIRKAADRTAEVMRQVQLCAGKTVPALRLLDLNETLRGYLPSVTATLPAGVTLNTRLTEGLAAVIADPVLLQHLVLNLVLNAREAVAETGGVVTIATGQSQQPAGVGVYLEVSDDGCGIPPAAQTHVFDPFFTTKGRRRGLGLSSARGIVLAHGGEIRLESAAGKGTTVRVELPCGKLQDLGVPGGPP